MKFTYLWTIVLFLLYFSCSKDADLPTLGNEELTTQISFTADSIPISKTVDFRFNYEAESYAINNGEEHPFSSEFSIWISDEGEPTFYVITYDLVFADFLTLNVADYNYLFEEIDNPHGYWFEITTSESVFKDILDGKTITGRLKIAGAKNEKCLTEYFTGDLNNEVYSFGNNFVEFDNHFSMSADFFPMPCIKIYSKNRYLCEFLDLETYTYTLEQLPEPHYLVTLPFNDLVSLVNGQSLYGHFEFQHKVIAIGNEVKVE